MCFDFLIPENRMILFPVFINLCTYLMLGIGDTGFNKIGKILSFMSLTFKERV